MASSPPRGLGNDVMNVELFTVMQAVVADWALPPLPPCQFPLSPTRKEVRFPGLSPFPIGAQVWIIRRRIVTNHDVSFDRRP